MSYSNKINSNNTATNALKTPFREISLKLSLILSGGIHILTPLILWLLLFILALLGINLLMFNPPKPKVKDIEFKIVNAPEMKPTQPTKNRAERDTRAGGKHDKKKPETDERRASPKPQPQPKPNIQPKPKAVQKPKTQPQKPKPQQQQKPQPKQVQQPAPKPPMPIPPKAEAPKPQAPPNPLAPPVKIAHAPTAAGPSRNIGPITKNTTTTTTGTSGTSGPAPVTLNSPSIASSAGSSGMSTRPSTGRNTYGSGGSLNPSPGNPSGAPGINAKRDPNFGPYMAELQRRIKRNWRPPRRNNSKRVILLFTIAKDGRLLNLKVYKPSGEPDTDRAAISAVQLSAPFKPLPSDFSGSSIDIQFTFDYNVFGVGGRSF